MPDVYRIQGATLEQMADAIRQGTGTTEDLSTEEMITLLRTMSNVGMRAKNSSGDVIQGAEIFNDYENNTAPYRYSTARGTGTTTYSEGQFVSGRGSGVSCTSAMLLTNNDSASGGSTTYPNIFAVNWDGKVAAGSSSSALRNNNWKYQFEIADQNSTLFAITNGGAPVVSGCYGTETPSSYFASKGIVPEEGMLYFQLIQKPVEEVESTDV